MPRLLEPLWLLLVTLGERKLAQTVEYLREENRILRNKLPDRIAVTPRERARLVRFGRPLGAAIAGLIIIVSPRTFARWAQGERRPRPSGRSPGRPRTSETIRDLILRLARETGWGYLCFRQPQLVSSDHFSSPPRISFSRFLSPMTLHSG